MNVMTLKNVCVHKSASQKFKAREIFLACLLHLHTQLCKFSCILAGTTAVTVHLFETAPLLWMAWYICAWENRGSDMYLLQNSLITSRKWQWRQANVNAPKQPVGEKKVKYNKGNSKKVCKLHGRKLHPLKVVSTAYLTTNHCPNYNFNN